MSRYMRQWKVSLKYKFQFDDFYVDITDPFAEYAEALEYQMDVYSSNEMWLNPNIQVVIRSTMVQVH